MYERNSLYYLNKGTINHNLGRALHRLGRYDEAIEFFDKAIEVNPKDGIYYYNKGYYFIYA